MSAALCSIVLGSYNNFKGHYSFRSAQELRSRIEILPQTPVWMSCEVSVPGGSTKDPLRLVYRDGLECFSFLFGNPLFVNHMDYSPRRVWVDDNMESRIYDEPMTGDFAWNLQVLNVVLFVKLS